MRIINRTTMNIFSLAAVTRRLRSIADHVLGPRGHCSLERNRPVRLYPLTYYAPILPAVYLIAPCGRRCPYWAGEEAAPSRGAGDGHRPAHGRRSSCLQLRSEPHPSTFGPVIALPGENRPAPAASREDYRTDYDRRGRNHSARESHAVGTEHRWAGAPGAPNGDRRIRDTPEARENSPRGVGMVLSPPGEVSTRRPELRPLS